MTIEDVETAVQRGIAAQDSRARASAILYPLITAGATLAIWQLATWWFQIPTFLLPSPYLVLGSLIQNAATILHESWVTTVEILLGYALSLVVGIPLAVAIYLWPPFGRSLYPLLISSQAMPKVAVAPLLIVWFGFGLLPKVLIAFLIAFFPIVINTVMGLAAIESEKIYLARSMGMDAMATFFKIRLPTALPSMFAGFKVSITLAVVGAVVGEFVGGNAGLGYQLMVANGSMDTPFLFASLVGLTVLGFLLFLIVEIAERVLIPHQAVKNALAVQATM